MAGEQNAVHVEGFALEPVGGREDIGHARHRCFLVDHDLDPDACVLRRAQQVVDHVETLLAFGVVDPADVDESHEAAGRIVTQELQHAPDLVGHDHQIEFAMRHFPVSDCGVDFARNMLAQFLQSFVHVPVFASKAADYRSMVPVRRIFFCNWRMP